MNAERAEFLGAMSELVSVWDHVERKDVYEADLVLSALERAAAAWKARMEATVKPFVVPAFDVDKKSPQATCIALLTSLKVAFESKPVPTVDETTAIAVLETVIEELSLGGKAVAPMPLMQFCSICRSNHGPEIEHACE